MKTQRKFIHLNHSRSTDISLEVYYEVIRLSGSREIFSLHFLVGGRIDFYHF
jgi:hypothetical protein